MIEPLDRLAEKTSIRVESAAEWRHVRSNGYWHWILWKGIIGTSLPIGLLVFLMTVDAFPPPSVLVWLALFWLGGGALMADWLWKKYEDEYGGRR